MPRRRDEQPFAGRRCLGGIGCETEFTISAVTPGICQSKNPAPGCPDTGLWLIFDT